MSDPKESTSLALTKQGFDCTLLIKPFHCPMCHYILREPHTVSCCNQIFCKSCIAKAKEDKKPCPSCAMLTFDHTCNKDLHRILLEFQVHCKNTCGWKGCLKFHDSHLNLNPPDDKWLKGCGLVQIQCIYCRDEVKQRQQLNKYLKKVFESRRAKAVYNLTITAKEKWYTVGLELKVDDEILENIQAEHGDNQECCYYEMLKAWIESTSEANWSKLLKALRKPSVNLETESQTLEKGILCDMASEHRVLKMTIETTEVKDDYCIQRDKLELEMAELESKRKYLEDKNEELKKLKLSRKEAELQPKIGKELSNLTEQLKIDEEKICNIENELQEGMESKRKLIKQITEGERQLRKTKDRMQDCISCLEKEIENLEEEERVKLEGRDLGESNRTPYEIIKAGAAGGAAGGVLAAALGAGAAGAGMSAALAIVPVPVGVAVGVYFGVKALIPKSEKELIVDQYTRLIETCIAHIKDLKIEITDCEKRLQILKKITKNC